MWKNLYVKVVSIVIGILLVSLFSIGWAVESNLSKFFSMELIYVLEGHLNAVYTLYENLENDMYESNMNLMRDKTVSKMGALPDYESAIKNVNLLLDVKSLTETLRNLEYQDLIATQVVYPEVCDYYVTSSGVFQKNEVKNLPENIFEILQKVKELSDEGKKPQHVYVQLAEYKKRDILVFLYPISKYFFYGKGFIITCVWEEEFCNTLNGIEQNSDNASVFMIGNDGIIVSAKDKNLLGQRYEDAFADFTEISSGGYSDFIKNLKTLQNSVIIHEGDMRFATTYHTNELDSKLFAFEQKTLLIFIIATLCAVFAALLMLKRTYMPLQQLIRSIRQRSDFNGCDTELLSNAFHQLIKNENDLKKRLQSNAIVAREHDIICLLNNHGRLVGSGGEIIENRKYYVALTVWIDDYVTYVSQYNSEEQFYTKSLINTMFEQYHKEEVSFGCAIMSDGWIGMICSTNSRDTAELHKVLVDISNEIKKAILFSISIGAGEYVTKQEEIWMSYNQSKEAVMYRYFKGRESIHFFQETMKYTGAYKYPSKEEKCLINQLLVGNEEKLCESIYDFVRVMKNKQNASVENVLRCFNHLVINVWTVVSNNSEFECSDVHPIRFLENLLRQETIDDSQKLLEGFLKELSSKRIVAQKSDWAEDMIAYIHEHFAEDIDINGLADYFGMSYSHVRKLFKEKTGKTIPDYLNTLRLGKAKELLAQTDMSIAAVAKESGYYNEQCLFRILKKQEGVTPGEYRQIARKKDRTVTL